MAFRWRLAWYFQWQCAVRTGAQEGEKEKKLNLLTDNQSVTLCRKWTIKFWSPRKMNWQGKSLCRNNWSWKNTAVTFAFFLSFFLSGLLAPFCLAFFSLSRSRRKTLKTQQNCFCRASHREGRQESLADNIEESHGSISMTLTLSPSLSLSVNRQMALQKKTEGEKALWERLRRGRKK